jgi:hypothetical protein
MKTAQTYVGAAVTAVALAVGGFGAGTTLAQPQPDQPAPPEGLAEDMVELCSQHMREMTPMMGEMGSMAR